MSWRTHPLVVNLRNLGRAVGVNRWLSALVAGPGYETKFQKTLFASVRKGDCVWDVGANVGLYTAKFAELVGLEGKVFAFEPSPINQARLKAAIEKHVNAILVPIALGDREAAARFQQGDDPLGATSRVLDGAPSETEDSLRVCVTRGDSLISAGTLPTPNIIKIDTEGSELDVLRGLEGVLKAPELRMLCIEVHFALLDERGEKDAPRHVENLLSAAGFRCGWPDPSHIVADRHLR